MRTRQLPRGPPAPPPPLLLPLLLLLLQTGACVDAYKPVVIVHGLFETPGQLETLSGFITEAHPGTEVTVIDLFTCFGSLAPMWEQVEGFRKLIIPIMNEAPDGIHLLCYSQGGLICRAFLATTPGHNVHTFIALSSPLAGQYGETEYLRLIHQVVENVYRLCYNPVGQLISICDYWNDPHHRSEYLLGNTFLPQLNGETRHEEMQSWKENFLRLEKLVLIGGPDDGVITPWQSSIFGFFNENENVIEMENQEYYQMDTFGLKTLDVRDAVMVCQRAGVQHLEWRDNRQVFDDCMEQWLI